MAYVAPLAGAWIEICYLSIFKKCCIVAPLAGAWIEIERPGLRFYRNCVAPLAGAWIEIFLDALSISYIYRRSPRGSVD